MLGGVGAAVSNGGGYPITRRLELTMYEVDLTREARPYDASQASKDFTNRKMAHIREMLAIAKQLGKNVWERHSSGGTIPYDGTMTVYQPDGTMLRCLVDWRGKHALEKDVEAGVSVRESRLLAASA
jgi:hypothetical protein